MIERIASKAEMRSAVAEARRENKRVGFVPTMGALHEGHLSLVRAACDRTDVVVVSVFVNPTQFGPGEDFEAYPRESKPTSTCSRAEGVDVVFTPSTEGDVRRPDRRSPSIPARSPIDWEGATRPGHFAGVATVVAKLLGIVRPDLAFFGEKDYQQLKIVQRLVRDLDLRRGRVGCPTVRERDGLAMSSRNAYLSAEERSAALGIPDALEAAARALAWGERDAPSSSRSMRETARQRGGRHALTRLRRRGRSRHTRAARTRRSVVPVRSSRVAWATTRLIDNCALTPPPSRTVGEHPDTRTHRSPPQGETHVTESTRPRRRDPRARRRARRGDHRSQLPARRGAGRRRLRRRLARALAAGSVDRCVDDRVRRRALHGRDREDPRARQDRAPARAACRLPDGRHGHRGAAARVEGRQPRRTGGHLRELLGGGQGRERRVRDERQRGGGRSSARRREDPVRAGPQPRLVGRRARCPTSRSCCGTAGARRTTRSPPSRSLAAREAHPGRQGDGASGVPARRRRSGRRGALHLADALRSRRRLGRRVHRGHRGRTASTRCAKAAPGKLFYRAVARDVLPQHEADDARDGARRAASRTGTSSRCPTTSPGAPRARSSGWWRLAEPSRSGLLDVAPATASASTPASIAQQRSDVLVIGSGIAGLTAALHASADRSVTLVTKGRLADTNTWYAQGGIAGAVGEADSVELHVADTLVVGQGLCDEAVVRAVVARRPRHSSRSKVSAYGSTSPRQAGSRSPARAATRLPRVLHSGDKTGADHSARAHRGAPSPERAFPFSSTGSWSTCSPRRAVRRALCSWTRRPASSRRTSPTPWCWRPVARARSSA